MLRKIVKKEGDKMSFKEQINRKNIPTHVSIIMDGNGRWATRHSLDRTYGHKEGVKTVKKILEAAIEIGVKYITIYAFSTENWNRPQKEVDTLMSLMTETLNKETQSLIENNIRLLVIGDRSRLKKDLKDKLVKVENITASMTQLTLTIALSYSSKLEITEAVKNIVDDVINNKIDKGQINESLIDNYLFTKDIPDPDLMIRTSGEYRISNFLLWQLAYAELYFTDVLWPDFDKEDFYKAIVEYQKRDRRFGKIKS